MDIKRNGSRPSTKAPEAYFSGAVRVEQVFQVGDPVRLNGGSVTFEWRPGGLCFTLSIPTGDISRASKTLPEWTEILGELSGPWAPVQDTLQAAADPQVAANEYILDTGELKLVS